MRANKIKTKTEPSQVTLNWSRDMFCNLDHKQHNATQKKKNDEKCFLLHLKTSFRFQDI